jgi:hypothetical protein
MDDFRHILLKSLDSEDSARQLDNPGLATERMAIWQQMAMRGNLIAGVRAPNGDSARGEWVRSAVHGVGEMPNNRTILPFPEGESVKPWGATRTWENPIHTDIATKFEARSLGDHTAPETLF